MFATSEHIQKISHLAQALFLKSQKPSQASIITLLQNLASSYKFSHFYQPFLMCYLKMHIIKTLMETWLLWKTKNN